MVSEADEAAGLSPGNEENEADRCFSPEKPRLPLSIEGIAARWIFRRGRFRRLRRRGIRIGGASTIDKERKFDGCIRQPS